MQTATAMKGSSEMASARAAEHFISQQVTAMKGSS